MRDGHVKATATGPFHINVVRYADPFEGTTFSHDGAQPTAARSPSRTAVGTGAWGKRKCSELRSSPTPPPDTGGASSVAEPGNRRLTSEDAHEGPPT